MGEIIYIQEWLMKKEPDVESIKKRIADIALEKLLLQSEQNQLINRLSMLKDE